MPDKPDIEALWNSFQSSSNPEWWKHSRDFFLHYHDLREHVQKIASPAEKAPENLPAKNTWEKIGRFVTNISDPFAWFTYADGPIVSLLAIVLIIFISWFGWYFALFSSTIGVPIGPAIAQSPTWWDYGMNVILIVSLFLPLIAYLRWGKFIWDRKHPGWFRLIYSAGIILFSVFEFSQLPPFLVNLLIKDTGKLLGLLITIFWFQLPAFSFGLILLWDLFSYLWYQSKTLLQNVRTFHNPLPLKVIVRILFEPIHSKEKTWHLSDLPCDELIALQNWAEVNRESSEKRLTPALFFVAIIGLLANTDSFNRLIQTIFDHLGEWLTSLIENKIGTTLSIESFLTESAIIIITLGLISLFFSLFLTIFQNITAQSLIIESCIIAEHAAQSIEEQEKKKDIEDQEEKKKEEQPVNRSWWAWIMGQKTIH